MKTKFPPVPSDKGYKWLNNSWHFHLIHWLHLQCWYAHICHRCCQDHPVWCIIYVHTERCAMLPSILCNDNLFYTLVVGCIITHPDVLYMDNITTRPYEWPCMTFISHTHPLINCSFILYISAIVYLVNFNEHRTMRHA